MVVTFNTVYLLRLYEGKSLTGKPRYNVDVVVKFKKSVLMLKNADSIREIRKFKGLNFEALKGDFKGLFSVRVDKQYRLILSVEKGTVYIRDVLVIEDLTNHYE